MTGAVCRAVLSAVLGLTAAVCVAGAGVPDPCGPCTFPTSVDLGACDVSGQPDATISFWVRLRDIGNFPLVNYLVTCTFNTDVRIYDTIPGSFVCCPCIETFTDLNGVATFHVPGAGRHTNGGASFAGASAATFSVGNCGSPIQVLGRAHVTTYDENGGVTTKGVEITDLSAWGADYNLRMSRSLTYRSDFNHSGALDIVDLSSWGRVFNSGSLRFGCGTLCP